jgi:uncharacterized protein YggE
MNKRNVLSLAAAGLAVSLGLSFMGYQTSRAQTATPTARPASPTATGARATPTGAASEGGAGRTVTVTGMGEVDVQPDEAFITVGVQTDADTAAEAMQANTTQMQDVLDALAGAGIDQADIQTQFVSVQPRYGNQTDPTAIPEIVGYTAINNVEVRVRDLAQLGDLLDTAIQAGANNVGGIRFSVSEASEVREDAEQAAFNDARAKAERWARLAGGTLGPVLSITDGAVNAVPVFGRDLGGLGAGGAAPIEPGTETLTVFIQVTWELGG